MKSYEQIVGKDHQLLLHRQVNVVEIVTLVYEDTESRDKAYAYALRRVKTYFKNNGYDVSEVVSCVDNAIVYLKKERPNDLEFKPVLIEPWINVPVNTHRSLFDIFVQGIRRVTKS